MSAYCAGCHAAINENSAVMVRSGAVYHQRCSPTTPCPNHPVGRSCPQCEERVTLAWAAGQGWWLLRLLAALAVGFAAFIVAPIPTVIVIVVLHLIRYAASEIGKAVRR